MIVFKFILSWHWFDTRSVNLFFPAHFFFFAKSIYFKKNRAVEAAKSKCLSSQRVAIRLQSFIASKDGARKT